MAGTQFSGWEAGSATLFDGAAWVTCLDEDSDLEVWADVTALALAIGSRVVPVDAAAHDDAVARVSHLPHLLALALAQVGAAGGALSLALAASSFADGTRVAGTRPELIRAMCEANRAALIGAMDEVLGILGVGAGLAGRRPVPCRSSPPAAMTPGMPSSTVRTVLDTGLTLVRRRS